MSEGVAAVMSRINQIRSAFGSGSGGLLGVQQSNTSGFDQALKSASRSSDPSAKSLASSGRSSTGTDPLQRIGVTSSKQKPGGSTKALGEDRADWPDGVPEEALRYKDEYLAASQATGVPLPILLAVSWAESAFQPGAESGVGAQGLMQLMPGTAAGLGVDPSDPAQNIMGGARYLAAQYEAFGSWDLAFAAYNAGPGAVQQYGGIPPYRETQNYISVINSYLERITPAPATAQLQTQAAGQRAALAAGLRSVTATVAEASPVGLLDGSLTPPVGEPLAVTAAPSLSPDEAAAGLLPGSTSASSSQPAPDIDLGATQPPAGPVTAGGPAGVAPPVEDPSGSPDQLLAGIDGTGTGAAVPDRLAAAQAPTTTPASATPTTTSTAAALPERIAAQVQQTRSNGQSTHKISVRLDPPELGALNVTFELKGDQVHMVVRPERAEGGQLLNQQRDRIAAALANEGFELSGFDVGSHSDRAGDGGRHGAAARSQYRAIDLDPTTDVALTVDRELRL